MKRQIATLFFGVFSISYMCFANAATLALFANNRTEGLVVMMGHEVFAVAPVWEGCVVQHYAKCVTYHSQDLKSTESKNQFLAKEAAMIVVQVIAKFPKYQQEIFLANILLTGGMTLDGKFGKIFTEEMQQKKQSFHIIQSTDTHDVIRGGLILSMLSNFDPSYNCLGDSSQDLALEDISTLCY